MDTKNTNQKGYSQQIPIILGILIILGLGAGMYYFSSKQAASQQNNPVAVAVSQTPTLSPKDASGTPNGDTASPAPTDAGETADWKTYTNDTYKYSIRYPNNWISYNNPAPDSVTFMTAPDYPSNGEEIGIEVKENKEGLDWKQWAEKDAKTTCTIRPCTPSLNFGDEIVVSGIKTSIVSGQLPMWAQEAVYLSHNGKIYMIRASSNTGKPTIIQNFREILSTFKFIN